MKEKNVTMEDFKKESKRRERKEKMDKFITNVLSKAEEHKEEIAFLTPVVIAGIGGITKVTKQIIRNRSLSKKEELKTLYCYDRSLGHYWKLKRPLSNNDWVQINDRRKRGESLADILSSMKVLN